MIKNKLSGIECPQTDATRMVTSQGKPRSLILERIFPAHSSKSYASSSAHHRMTPKIRTPENRRPMNHDTCARDRLNCIDSQVEDWLCKPVCKPDVRGSLKRRRRRGP